LKKDAAKDKVLTTFIIDAQSDKQETSMVSTSTSARTTDNKMSQFSKFQNNIKILDGRPLMNRTYMPVKSTRPC
jgi:hypothetical protein